ncbi:energy transducer TonB [Bacteroides fragilis]|uniref:TonB-dependent receptor n=2 Tax=Bacteroides fragilis TaxID=817 RepID=Q5LI05_BACFN|nr:energy transducer TonB [Bacteroides fragilis]MCE9437248.1 energy transducer TonB [Bacteroides fragilis]CAH06225.1 putative TonB-dependent receptor [Bacteroides fragilis NCTC 9343]
MAHTSFYKPKKHTDRAKGVYFNMMKHIVNLCFFFSLLSLNMYADNWDFVDMGVRADNGDILYWSTGDMVLLQNGEIKIADYGEFGSQFGWGDITGKVTGDNLNDYGGVNSLKEISGNKDYDIVRAKLGKPYRLPTYTEIDRLFKNCSEEFVKIPRKLNSVDENGVPLWLQGQWMWQHVIHTQKRTFGGWLSVKIDGLLVNVLSSEGKVLFEGLYSYSNGVLKFWDFTLYLDMDRKLIKDNRGEYFKKVSSQSNSMEICGYMLTSKINGNKLFFPVSHSYSAVNTGSGVLIMNNNQKLSYWTGTLYNDDFRYAASLMFASDGWGIGYQKRSSHFRIKAVKGGNGSVNSLQSISTKIKSNDNKVISSEINRKEGHLEQSVTEYSFSISYSFGGRQSVAKPQYSGGESGLPRFFMKNVKYPTLAQESNIKGKVVVQFLVNEDGSLSNFKIVQSVHQSLDNEVLRVLMLLPEFIPASDEKGNPIKAYATISFTFETGYL